MAAALANGIKTLEDLGQLTGFMNKLVIETALNEEMAQHLGHEKHQKKQGSNTRNGYSKKTVISDDDELELAIPRDRESRFEPQLVKKHQTRIDKINHQILFLYAKGMTTREITNTFKEMYDVDISPTLISKVTDSVKEQALAHFEEIWDDKYPYIGQSWRRHWENLSPFFVYPQDIRKAIYTTNAIESLNSVIRHAIKKRKVFPTDDSVKKVIYLAIQQASKKWTMPIQNWKSAMNRLIIEFGDRMTRHLLLANTQNLG